MQDVTTDVDAGAKTPYLFLNSVTLEGDMGNHTRTHTSPFSVSSLVHVKSLSLYHCHTSLQYIELLIMRRGAWVFWRPHTQQGAP